MPDSPPTTTPSPLGPCPRCGYPIDPGRCPECGTVTLDPDRLSTAVQRRLRLKLLRRAVVLGFAYGVIPLIWSVVAVVLFMFAYPMMSGLELDAYPRDHTVGERLIEIAMTGTLIIAPALTVILCTFTLLLPHRWPALDPQAKRQRTSRGSPLLPQPTQPFRRTLLLAFIFLFTVTLTGLASITLSILLYLPTIFNFAGPH